MDAMKLRHMRARLEAALYVANHVEHPTRFSIGHLLYLADRMHLHEYGRLITRDEYVAMGHGPVPSEIYDLMKHVSGDRHMARDPWIEQAFSEAFESKGGWGLRPTRDADLDALSRSDVECLDAAIREYGHLGFNGLKAATHDGAYKATPANGRITTESMASLAENANDLLTYLADPHP